MIDEQLIILRQDDHEHVQIKVQMPMHMGMTEID